MIVVTAVTGQLGGHVIRHLLERVPASEVAVAVRTVAKGAALAARGVDVREGDYSRPATLKTAFQRAERLLLISSAEVGQRALQHQNAIDAAKAAGVKHIVYTSILHAEFTTMELAREHQLTERAIRASGIPFTFLRNGWYTENYTQQLGSALAQGAVYGCAGSGRIGTATREDYAEAAVAVLTGEGHEGRAYELAGDTPFTLAEYAAEVSRQSGKKIVYTDLPFEGLETALVKAGVPKPMAHVLADCDLGIARGELADASGDLRRLIGRPTTAWTETVRTALAGLKSRATSSTVGEGGGGTLQ